MIASEANEAHNLLLTAHALGVGIAGRTFCRGLDLEVRRGERLAILGRNGAGKSTLLATLAGLAAPETGEVRIGGTPYAKVSPREAALRRGFLPQGQHDAFASTVLETAMIGRHPHLGRWQWESADDADFARTALAFVGLAGIDQREVRSLSGGERQRLAVASLLTQEPDLYLLDEPLTHLDLNHAIAVLEVFSRCASQGAGVVMVLHEPGLAARYCERVLLLYGDSEGDGESRTNGFELGPCGELLTAERLSRLYGHPLRALDDRGKPWFVPA